MLVRVLGAHNLESRDTRCTSLLLDGRLAIDAGSLTSGLDFDEQARVEALLLTHQHMDHVRDLPGIGLTLRSRERSLPAYMSRQTAEAVTKHLLNGILYPEFHKYPKGNPTVQLRLMSPENGFHIGPFTVLPLRATHVDGSVGLRVSDGEGAAFYFTSDSGPLIEPTRARLQGISVLITEVTMSSANESAAIDAGHMTPRLLEQELFAFEKSFGRPLPRVVVVHLDPLEEPTVREELAGVEKRLEVQIDMAYSGMEFEVQ